MPVILLNTIALGSGPGTPETETFSYCSQTKVVPITGAAPHPLNPHQEHSVMEHRKDVGDEDMFDELIEVIQKCEHEVSTSPGVLQGGRNTAISINVVGSKLQAYSTRPNRSVGRSRGLLHVPNTYEI